MTLDIGLSVLWALSWSLLTWNMSGTLTHTCNTENWNDTSGIMICRIYKALFTFALVGLYAFSRPLPFPLSIPPLPFLVLNRRKKLPSLITNPLENSISTLAALTLDVLTRRRQTRLGTYNAMQDVKLAANDPIDPYQQGGDMPAPGTEAFGADVARPYRAQQPIEAQRSGYSVPVEQGSYDTGYHSGYGGASAGH